MPPLEYAPLCLRDKAVVRIRTDIRTRLNYMKPHPLTGIHAMTGRPLRRNSSHWCHRPLLAEAVTRPQEGGVHTISAVCCLPRRSGIAPDAQPESRESVALISGGK